jgi:hypothetical protein
MTLITKMAQDVTNMPQVKQYKLSVKRILLSCVKYHLSPGPFLQCTRAILASFVELAFSSLTTVRYSKSPI